MRKLLFSLLAMLFVMGSSAGIVAAQDDATPEADDTEDVATGSENPRDPQVGDTVTIYDSDSGDALAEVTVDSVELGWEGYGEYDAPERGLTYLLVTVTISNLAERSSFEVSSYGFGVQDNLGNFWASQGYLGDDAELENPLLESGTELEGEESATFSLPYIVFEDVGLNYLYYSASGTLVTVVDLSEA
jgi:hypothetical protein